MRCWSIEVSATWRSAATKVSLSRCQPPILVSSHTTYGKRWIPRTWSRSARPAPRPRSDYLMTGESIVPGVPIKDIVACGGLPDKNKLLMQIYADITRREFSIAASSQAPALGSSMWAAVAAGGAWKPAVISFGQGLVPADLDRAMSAAGRCDLFVAAGTSLVVGPINQMFDAAHAAGAPTAILTASATPYDASCDLKISEPVERVLPAVQRGVCA